MVEKRADLKKLFCPFNNESVLLVLMISVFTILLSLFYSATYICYTLTGNTYLKKVLSA